MSSLTRNVSSQMATYPASLLLTTVIAPEEIGRRIKRAREKRGWTQLQLAMEANVSPSSVTRWEAGKLPPVRELIRLADLLEIPPDQLVEDEPADDITALRSEVADLRGMLEELLRRAS